MTGTLAGGQWDRSSAPKRSTSTRRRLTYVPLMAMFAASAVAAGVGWQHEPPAPPPPPPPATQPVPSAQVTLGAPGTEVDPERPTAGARPAACTSDLPTGRLDAWTGANGEAAEQVLAERAADLAGPFVAGENGWAFWNDVQVDNFSQTLGRAPWTTEQTQVWVDALTSLQDRLAAQDRDLLVLVAPSVGTVHPEHLPAWSQPLRGVTRFEQLLAAGPDLPIVDVRGALQDAAGEHPVFSAVNSHWTPFGAAVAWTTALDCLEELDPAYTDLRRPDLSQVRVDPAPSEFASFGFENAPTDWAVPVSRDGLAGITEHTATGEAPLDGDIDLMELPARTVAEQGAPHTVLFARDSQGNSVSPWVADSFVSVCHEPHGIDKPDQRMDVVATAEACGADLVVLEFTERYLGLPPL